jgi:hypothetical protein
MICRAEFALTTIHEEANSLEMILDRLKNIEIGG